MALNRCCSKWRITWKCGVQEWRGCFALGMGTQSEALACKGRQMRRVTAGAQPDRGGEGFLLRREIEHKALLPQVQALYTRATYYLVSNYKTISHQA